MMQEITEMARHTRCSVEKEDPPSSSASHLPEAFRRRASRATSINLCLSPDNQNSIEDDEEPHCRYSFLLRAALVLSLVIVAVTAGTVTFLLIQQSEQDLVLQHYEAQAIKALDVAQERTTRRRVAVQSMARIAASAFPSASAWPNVALPGFETIAKEIISTSDLQELSFYPKVQPEELEPGEQEKFEEFAYSYFYNERFPPFPNGTAVHSFGKGVWKQGRSITRIRDSNGEAFWGSPNMVLFPMLQSSEGADIKLLYKVHANEIIGKRIDKILACAEERKLAQDRERDCGCSGSSIVAATRTSSLIEPIYPARDLLEFTGIIIADVSWDKVVEQMFGDTVATGLTVVVDAGEEIFSYGVDQGNVTFLGHGDFHDQSYSKLGRWHSLVKSGVSDELFTIAIYPTKQFFEAYTTENSNVGIIATFLVVFLSSMFFFAYDFAMHRKTRTNTHMLQAKRRYMRFVSHEVRSPLNAVCMGVILLKEEIEKGIATSKKQNNQAAAKSFKEWLALLEDVSTSAQSSVHVLNELLHYDKIESGTLDLDLSVLSVWDMILNAASEFKLAAKMKNVSFNVDKTAFVSALSSCGDVSQHCVVGDVAKLTQILRSLVANAIKFTPEGGNVTIRIDWAPAKQIGKSKFDKHILESGEVVSFERHGSVLLQVVDTGAGMSEEQQLTLSRKGIQFDVNELQSEQGSGLGLFITKAIVNEHGGYLKVASEGVGQGTTFTCSLPLYHRNHNVTENTTLMDSAANLTADSGSFRVPGDSNTRRLSVEEKQSPVVPSTPPSSSLHRPPLVEEHKTQLNSTSLRVLVVDDVTSNRKLLKRLVANHGHIVEEAVDGQEAVEKVADAMSRDIPYDTILMDYEMPRLCGPEAAKLIRETLKSDAFIVGVTGNVLAEDMNYFSVCGADAVLPKPIQMFRLKELWMDNDVWVRPNSEK